MIKELATSGLIGLGTFSTRGVSPTDYYVQQQIDEGRRQLGKCYTLGLEGSGVLGELFDVATQCQESNWDGYGAEPVSRVTVDVAYRFLAALPLGTPPLSVGAEPDGHITLEWYRSPHCTLSISLSPDCELHYAALLPNSGKAYGMEYFFDGVPNRILALIEAVSLK